MFVRFVRWFLILAPVLAGVLLLIFGTDGAISSTFGMVLIGIGPIVWMWNWFLRMSFDEEDRKEQERQDEQRRRASQSQQPRQRSPLRPPESPRHEHAHGRTHAHTRRRP